MTGQMSIYDFLESQSDLPCDDCIFDKAGGCDHISEETDDYKCFCVEGSFRIRHGEDVCPECGRQMEIAQSVFGNDFGRCKCGTVVSYNNHGNRSSYFEMWRKARYMNAPEGGDNDS